MRSKKEIRDKREEMIKKQEELPHSSASMTEYAQYRGIIWALNWMLIEGCLI